MYGGIPVFGVAIFGLSEVEDVLTCPVGGLLPTHQQVQFICRECLKAIHWKYSVKPTCIRHQTCITHMSKCHVTICVDQTHSLHMHKDSALQ